MSPLPTPRLTEAEPAQWPLASALALFVFAFLCAILAVGLMAVSGGTTEMTAAQILVGALVPAVILGAGTLELLRRRQGAHLLFRDLQRGSPLSVVGLGLVVGMLMLTLNGVTILVMEAAGVDVGTNNPYLFDDLAFTPNQSLYLALTIVLLAPVAEEFFFRGYLYRALRARSSMPAALLLSAALFALAHLEWTLMLPLFLGGIMLALVYEWTGSLAVPIVAHMVMNGTAIGVTFYLLENGLPG